MGLFTPSRSVAHNGGSVGRSLLDINAGDVTIGGFLHGYAAGLEVAVNIPTLSFQGYNKTGYGEIVGRNETEWIRTADWSDVMIHPVPQAIYSLLTTYITIVAILAMIFNGIVIGTTYKSKNLRKPLNYMLLNLAIADFLSACVGGMMCMAANAVGWYIFGKIMCWIQSVVVGTLGIVNLISIVLLSVSRWLVICKPFGVYVPTERHATIAVAFTWIWGTIWHLPPLFWEGYDLEGIGTSCGPTWQSKDTASWVYLILYMTFCFFIPLVFLIISYVMIIWSIRKASEGSSVDKSKSAKAERSATKMTVLIVIAFMTCWTPYAAVALSVVFNPGTQLNQYVGTFPAFFAKSATIYNPCIYILTNRQFRKGVFAFLGISSKSVLTTDGESSVGMASRDDAARKSVA